MQYNENLLTMQGAVVRARNGGTGPGIDPALVNSFLNQRQRMVLNMRPYWSGLVGRGILNVPQAQSFTNVTVTQGSVSCSGVGTSWPVSDVVNTTISAAVINPGYQAVTPASMVNITTDTLLFVDSAGTGEVVPVLEVTPTQFKANFKYIHTGGFTATCSSLSYQQWWIGYMYPVYTITAVVSATQLLLDQQWAGVTLTGTSVTIRKQYYTFATDQKDFISVVDPQQGLSLMLHYPREQVDFDDPQRSAVDWPDRVVDYSPNLNGNQQFELWPSPTSQRQLYFTYVREWPQMVAANDRPPYFMDPSILIYGALADAWTVKLPGENTNGNFQAAQLWEQKFQMAVMHAMSADNGKRMAAYSWPNGGLGFPGGANYAQSHDSDVYFGNY